MVTCFRESIPTLMLDIAEHTDWRQSAVHLETCNGKATLLQRSVLCDRNILHIHTCTALSYLQLQFTWIFIRIDKFLCALFVHTKN